MNTVVAPRKTSEERTDLALSELTTLTTEESEMSDLAIEKRNKIAQAMGWTSRRAAGYIEGRFYRRSEQDMPERHKVGTDDYSKGFRTGYNRQNQPDSEANIQQEPLAG